MAKTSKRAVAGRMKAKGFEHIKILKPAVEPSKAEAAKIRAAVRAFYRDRAAAKRPMPMCSSTAPSILNTVPRLKR